jgi:glutathione S-transferase
MLRVFGDINSGNCYKIRLILNLLSLDHEWVHVDILNGESRTSDFLSMNPNGKIPVLQIADEDFLSESNAILWYLGRDSRLVPAERRQQADLLKWLFFEQYSHEPFIATARFIVHYLKQAEGKKGQLEEKHRGGDAALGVMESHLSAHSYLACDRYTIADIALYAYTHVADQGGFHLENYPMIQSWLDRVASEPGHISMSAAAAEQGVALLR